MKKTLTQIKGNESNVVMLILSLIVLRGTAPKPKISMFCVLSQ